MDVLAARIVVTVLLTAASGLSLGAGISALRKWSDYRARKGAYEAQRARGEEMIARHYREVIEHRSADSGETIAAVIKRQQAEARAAGFAAKTAGEDALDNLVGERPRETYQARGEVGAGLAALILATTASILGVWCT